MKIYISTVNHVIESDNKIPNPLPDQKLVLTPSKQPNSLRANPLSINKLWKVYLLVNRLLKQLPACFMLAIRVEKTFSKLIA